MVLFGMVMRVRFAFNSGFLHFNTADGPFHQGARVTESNNAAIHAALKDIPQKRHIITSAVKHSLVLNDCLALEKENYGVT